MAIQKQGVNYNFGQGLDTKTDKNQVPAGKMLVLDNAVFNKGGLLTKRNGFGNLTKLPTLESTTLSTLNDTLIATGGQLQAYSPDLQRWLPQGTPLPLDLKTQALARSSRNQNKTDSILAPNGMVISVYYEGTQGYYLISDSATGQAIRAPQALPAASFDARVSVLGSYFIVTFLTIVSASTQLQYIAVPIQMPSNPTAAATIRASVSATAGYDVVVRQNQLFYAVSDSTNVIIYGFLTAQLALSAQKSKGSVATTLISLTANNSADLIYTSYVSGSGVITFSYDSQLDDVMAPVTVTLPAAPARITSIANSAGVRVYAEIANTVTQLGSIQANYVTTHTITTAGVASSVTTIARSVGLASKPAIIKGNSYVLTAFNGAYQPTYFLIDSTGKVVAKLAYSNGGGYMANQVLPAASVLSNTMIVPYLFKVQVQAVNKAQGAATSLGVYAQTGVNLAFFNFDSIQLSVETAKSLHLTGGVQWQYDGVNTVEHSYHLWPEAVQLTASSTGGTMTAQQYYYQVIYEWTDAGGNLHRSAPSIPKTVTTTGATSSVSIAVQTLWATDKNDVRILIYRWSAAQQSYYQVTTVAAPVLNNKTVDFVTFTDTQPDTAIVGNSLIYTTGGVIENIGAPASVASTVYGDRVWLLDAENRDLLWFSKKVVQGEPVEFSDLFTQYVPPTRGTQETKAIAAMDDKLIIFKSNAMSYLVGVGPDSTGSQNDFTPAVFITGTVGTSNSRSIVSTPLGLMFQSDKGIWLLGRDLSTKYIGAPVEQYNNETVVSALLIPGTNQVRFTLANSTVLMYDYYFDQWGTFSGVSALSATLYNGLHTFINQFGQVRQETVGKFLDGSNPVLISFTTAWLKVSGLQGYQRAYYMFLLSNYLTPHKLNVSIAYDFSSSVLQTTIIEPNNYSAPWGGDAIWGSGEVWGGPSDVEQWRVFFEQQKCQAIQISVSEIYDPSFGVPAGEGLTISGINLVVGGKLTYPKPPTSGSVG